MADYKPVENMSNLYDKFYAKFAPSYKPQSASTLKDTLSRAMRPAYDKQITQRIDTGKANRGEIVASSTGSGMGTSTTMQDRLLKARDAEAKDIAGIESDYNAALYSALLNRMNAQDELSLTAENQARNTALGLAQSMYGQVYGAGGGGGGWGRRGGSSGGGGDGDGTYQDALNELKKRGYTTRSAVDYLQKGTNPQKVQKSQPKKKVTNGGVGINYLAAR